MANDESGDMEANQISCLYEMALRSVGKGHSLRGTVKSAKD